MITPIAYLSDADDDPAKIYEVEETGRTRSAGLKSALAELDPQGDQFQEPHRSVPITSDWQTLSGG